MVAEARKTEENIPEGWRVTPRGTQGKQTVTLQALWAEAATPQHLVCLSWVSPGTRGGKPISQISHDASLSHFSSLADELLVGLPVRELGPGRERNCAASAANALESVKKLKGGRASLFHPLWGVKV